MRSENARGAAATRVGLALAVFGWCTPVAAQPRADAEPRWGSGFGDAAAHRRPVQLAVMALLYGSFTDVVAGPTHNVFGPGGSVRGTIPLLHDGLLARSNDALDIEIGSDVYTGIPDRYHTKSYVGIVPDLSLRWSFYTGRASALYVKAGAQIDIGIERPWWPYLVWPSATVGMLFAISQAVELKVELGWPALRAGFAFDLL